MEKNFEFNLNNYNNMVTCLINKSVLQNCTYNKLVLKK